jgi:branched-chain amino acid transport system substrate-binding protein
VRFMGGIAAIALGLALGTASCGGRDEAFRIAVQVECQGGFAGVAEPELAGALFPLLQRGAELAGRSPSEGVQGARIAGRPIDVKVGCTESLEPTYAVLQLRELVEGWHPDVVVGSGIGGQDGIIVRDLARRYPTVTFVLPVASAQEITLFHPAPNVFRLVPDNTQSVAGLGSYAYRILGWRRAAVVGGPYPYPDDWEQAAGFIAEFCSLGGTVTRDDGGAWTDPATAAARYETAVDGVAVLSSLTLAPELLKAMAKQGHVASRLVLGGWAVENHANLDVPGADLRGVTLASMLPLHGGPPGWRRWVASFAKTYHGIPSGTDIGVLVVGYRNAVEAVASALERVDGDPGPGGAKLRETLAGMTVAAVPSPMRFDENRQAVTTVYLSRLGRTGAAGARTVSVIRRVDESYGGIFGPPHGAPTATRPRCDRSAKAPPWAR